MSKAQLVITAVVLEGRSKSEVARDYDVSRFWVQQLVRRYETEGAAAFEPRSRRPHRNPRAVDIALEDTIVRLRKTLDKQGYDAGAATIAEYLTRDPSVTNVPAVSTIWRILSRRGFVTPQPQKRPRSAWKRFQAELPNQCWQADVTHWRLADHTEVEILDLIDDHSRLAIASRAQLADVCPSIRERLMRSFPEPSKSISSPCHARPHSPSCNTRSTTSLRSTTTADPTARCPTAPPPRPPTPPGPKPAPANASTPTAEYVPTVSTTAAPSPCASPDASTTSASAEPTPEPTFSCWSKTSTSESSTPPPENYSAN